MQRACAGEHHSIPSCSRRPEAPEQLRPRMTHKPTFASNPAFFTQDRCVILAHTIFLHDFVGESGSTSNSMNPARTSTHKNHCICTRVCCVYVTWRRHKILASFTSNSMEPARTNTQEFWFCQKINGACRHDSCLMSNSMDCARTSTDQNYCSLHICI